MRDLLGGKGANVAEMTRILGPERVPAGFTITTEACVAYMEAGESEPEAPAPQVADALARVGREAGEGVGASEHPLLGPGGSRSRAFRRGSRSRPRRASPTWRRGRASPRPSSSRSPTRW